MLHDFTVLLGLQDVLYLCKNCGKMIFVYRCGPSTCLRKAINEHCTAFFPSGLYKNDPPGQDNPADI